jgi:hypothetical protein
MRTTIQHRALKRILVLTPVAILLGCAGAVAVTEIWPAFGAQVANQMRDLFGPQVVAQIEAVVFQAQDAVRQWQYQYGGQQAEAPWDSEAPLSGAAPASTWEATLSPYPATRTPTPFVITPTLAPQTQPPEAQDRHPTTTASPAPTPTPTAYVWQLPNLHPFGALEGEGIWQPYLSDLEGHVVARRTFLQPDPARPYALVAIVAFDLTRTRLHFVLGFIDPARPDGPKGDGLIPEKHRQAGALLAAFNGGFRAANGMFGAMANGIVALPPVSGKATVGIYQNGEIRIGNWGTEIVDTPELEAWRQNCSLIIQTGEISPKVYNDSITDWGGSISNHIVTRRSGMGIDREAKTLYYFAGPSLSMPALADAMLASGVHDGMLLDINNFWVHFTAFRAGEGGLAAEALLPEDMIDQVDRYLGASPVDFFYVTSRESDPP